MPCPRHGCAPFPTPTILSRQFSLLFTFILLCSQLWAGDAPKGVSLKWEPIRLVNGSPVLLKLASVRLLKSVSGNLLDHDVFFSFDARSNTWVGLAGISLETRPGSYPLKIKCETKNGETVSLERSLTVHAGKYLKIKATVPKQFIEPTPEQQHEISEDQALKKQVFAHVSDEREWSGRFLAPVSARISDVFGTTRIFNGKEEGVHQGLDYAVPQGTPVAALNRGTVLLAKPLFFEGTCVIVDHGQGLLSLYMHLSELKVKEGDPVTKGQIVGLSGGTGRATGPHLHVAVRWEGIYLNPATLLSLQLP